ncbi:MAG: hypothetical protein L0Z70_01355 [Chloroflexi bacterium]|nr:hypothetical protein [Chloroflexota bacterium]
MKIPPDMIEWLLAGDPAIRWQAQRDLLDAAPQVYTAERQRVANEGWGADLLSRQDADGRWGDGVYSPKWISTTYTLLLLRHLGLPAGHPQALRGCVHFWKRGLEADGGVNLFHTIHYSETCVNGMILALCSYFRYPDERVHSIVEFLLREQMPDGGWNCERVHGATHASFHTTLSVLEALAEYRQAFPRQGAATLEAAGRAHEFLLLHRLYRSHRTGEPADASMTRMIFPPRWRYDFARALDYFQSVSAARDERMDDAMALLHKKRRPDGLWPAYAALSGRVFFHMEPAGGPGRWNTLRALRILRWWDQDTWMTTPPR